MSLALCLAEIASINQGYSSPTSRNNASSCRRRPSAYDRGANRSTTSTNGSIEATTDWRCRNPGYFTAAFMRSAPDADANIGLSKSQPFVHHEIFAAQRIDRTVTEQHRNGLLPAARDTLPISPDAYDPDDTTDPRHGTFGAGHDDAATPERADAPNAFHRERGRASRMLETQLSADGYMNPLSNVAQRQSQWAAHQLT